MPNEAQPDATAVTATDAGYAEVMSFGQQRLWVLDKLLPDRSVYNTPRVERLTGPLDVAALERSIGEIRCRHDVLRTRFAVVDGEPRQLIAPPSPLPLAGRRSFGAPL